MTTKQLYIEIQEKRDNILLNLVNLPKGPWIESKKYSSIMIQSESIEHKRAIKELKRLANIQKEIIPDEQIRNYSIGRYWEGKN